MITVNRLDENTFDVVVKAASVTTHRVTVPEEYYQKLTGGKISKEKLVEDSFKFLLKRENNTMIFTEFQLPVIGRYFPEYVQTMKGAQK